MASSHYKIICADFNKILHAVNRASRAFVKIECLRSETSEAIQAADFIAGTIHNHYRLENKAEDSLLWELITKNSLKIHLLKRLI